MWHLVSFHARSRPRRQSTQVGQSTTTEMRSSRDAGAIQERVIELISELVHAQGYDVEDVVVTSAGKHSAVRIMVDSDAGIELDAAAEISRLVSNFSTPSRKSVKRRTPSR